MAVGKPAHQRRGPRRWCNHFVYSPAAMTMSSGQKTVLWVAGVLASTLLILAFALIPLEASEYSAAFAAIQAIFTVVTIGVAAFVFVGQREQTTRALELADAQVKVTEDGIRRDHDRRRKEATLEYVGRMNDNTKDARRQLHEWSSGKAISLEQANDLRGKTANSWRVDAVYGRC